jgi:hypothetical protein
MTLAMFLSSALPGGEFGLTARQFLLAGTQAPQSRHHQSGQDYGRQTVGWPDITAVITHLYEIPERFHPLNRRFFYFKDSFFVLKRSFPIGTVVAPTLKVRAL